MELLERFKRGDEGAFEVLFRQFQSQVYAWIVRIVRDRGAAEELTVETFWRIYRARERFDPQRKFGAWARRIATNLAFDHMRKRNLTVELREDFSQEKLPDAAVQEETRRKIREAFARLPAKFRVPATLALVEERSHEEIASALGISANAVKLRVFRAVRVLRKELAKLGVKP
ncbi:MAG: RNA polymerase sigma factor [Candidatus Acidiferrales bacterium]